MSSRRHEKVSSRQLSNLLLIYKLPDIKKYMTKEDPKAHAHPTIEAGA